MGWSFPPRVLILLLSTVASAWQGSALLGMHIIAWQAAALLDSPPLLAHAQSASPPEDRPLKLLHGGFVYDPTPKGRKDILLGGNTILSITDPGTVDWRVLPDVQFINITGLSVLPGLIDPHQHVAGGGGEMSFKSRTPEAKLSEIVDAGITTVVGILGTDSVTRSLDNLLAKVTSLEEEGLTTYMWSGAYHYPSPTITESPIRDVMLISKVMGIGELAISDHRSSWPSTHEVAQLASDVRVGGLLSGKSSKVHAHMGTYKSGLDVLWSVVNTTDIPITQFHPTHMSGRGPKLLQEGKEWVAAGGYVDFTVSDPSVNPHNHTINTLRQWDRDGVDMTHVTLSTDAYGSLPTFDSEGRLVSYKTDKPDILLKTIRALVLDHHWSIDKAIQFNTVNLAEFLGFQGKGKIATSYDADVIVVDNDVALQYVFAKGHMMKTPNWTKHGMFE